MGKEPMKNTYSKFFNLSENPFGETPDPDFYFASLQHGKALSSLSTGLKQGKGFSVLTGEVGTGKTLISRILLSSFIGQTNTALILYPKFSEIELLQSICEEFEIPALDGPQTAKAYVDHLNRYLLAAAENGRQSILIIDEAQALSPEALETIRLLTNLETKTQKLLQIVLVGQPELLQTLNREDLRQLKQRVSVHATLNGLSDIEIEKYIRNRLEQGGTGNFIRFDSKAVKAIEELSNGIPRRINQICERILNTAEDRKIRLITKEFVCEVFGIKEQSFLSRFMRNR
jgi:general secretion pathway protein A